MKEEVKWLFSTKDDRDLFLKEILSLNELFEVVEKDDEVKRNFFNPKAQTLKSEVDLYQIATILITTGTVSVIVKSISKVVITYLKTSKSKLVLKNGDKSVVFEYKNSDKIKEHLNEEEIRELLFPENKKSKK